MKVILELDVNELIGAPELRVDLLVELDDMLIVLGLGHVGGAHEERNPVVAAVGVEVSGQEVVAVNVVAALLVDEDDDVDLVSTINVVFLTLID